MRAHRGRPTKKLLGAAQERFHHCEECWEDNAVWYLEDVLKPLRLSMKERKRLMRELQCPHCGSRLRDYYYDRVVGYEDREIRDAQRFARYNNLSRSAFNRFHQFLLKHPTLGGVHPFGQLLRSAVRRARKRTLQPAAWFRARVERGSNLSSDDFLPPDPRKYSLSAGRFNSAGQLAYYVTQAPGLAAIEVMKNRKVAEPTALPETVWIAKVHVRNPIKVLDLTIQAMERTPKLPLVLTGLVYSGALSDYGDDLSKPQYRVPHFLADLLRLHGFSGALYTRRRDSGFPNPEAWGTNLVVLQPESLRVDIETPRRYSWKQTPFGLMCVTGIQPVTGDEQPPYTSDVTYPDLADR
jgi:RES domain